ncbi:MAG: NADH-quinone oxidoreductase subunit C [Verrucomicrobiae bacterium]|nr:NADH-quinone oxidoreductase subunit C [Verrucomicrobiae bacterium]
MMIETQPLEPLDRAALPARVAALAKEGWRLVQICCSCRDAYEVTYSFDREGRFLNLRIGFSKEDPALPSITESYFGAFAYENEMQDLFGLRLDGLKLNFHGNFYRLAKKNPFLDPPAAGSPGASPAASPSAPSAEGAPRAAPDPRPT